MIFRKKRKQLEPEEILAKILTEAITASRGGHDAKPGLPVKMIAGPGFNMIDCASIADQIGSLELTGRSFLLIHEALLAFHAHEADDDLCEACHESLHELIKTTANTLKGMVETAARK